MKHSPAPWTPHCGGFYDCNGKMILGADNNDAGSYNMPLPADDDLIVNAPGLLAMIETTIRIIKLHKPD